MDKNEKEIPLVHLEDSIADDALLGSLIATMPGHLSFDICVHVLCALHVAIKKRKKR